MTWSKLLKSPKIVIGMLHLPALPGSPLYTSDLKSIRDRLKRDVAALDAGGVHALMMENFGDVPFSSKRVDAETIAVMTALAAEVKRETGLPLGINVLRNDGESALAIALAVGAEFIRVNVLAGARVTDQGVVEGISYPLMRMRARLGAAHIGVMADVDVKHSAPLAARPIADEVEDTVKRGLADAVIVSGAGTGKVTDPKKVSYVVQAAAPAPVFLGSGVNVENLSTYLKDAKGFIVGTAFKKEGRVSELVDIKRVKAFMAKF